MKKRITIAIALFLAVVNYIAAENRVSVMDFSISAGETKEVSVLLDNETQYVAFQFDLYLPMGISLAGYEVNSERVPASTEVSMAQQEDGSYRFLAAAMAMEPIVGNNGCIITLKLKASANVVTGNRSGYLRNVKLSKEDGTGSTTFEVPFTVKVLEPSIVTAKSYTKEYGEKNPTFEYDVKGGELEGAPEISCEATAVSPVGTYPIVVKKGTVTNYNDSYVNGTLTITKAPLTITAQSYTIKQGEVLPTFEVSYSGFKNNETEEALTKKPTITCIATSGSAVGTYDIVVSGAESGNYDIAFANGTLVIADADPVTVTAKSYTRAYGDANPTFEYTSEGKALEGAPEISCEATSASPVGTYPIVVKKGTVTNYNDSYVNGTLTITKAPLTITAQNYVIKQGEELPAFEASYTGFKNGETDNVLTRKPRIVCDATSSNKLGTYGITVSDAESQNYEMEYVSGTLSVIDADAVVVTAKSYYREYGESNPTFEYDVVGKTLVGTPEISCEATSASPVGTYPIVVKKGTVTNYNDSYVDGTLTITKAPLTITAQSCTIKQGETLPNFEVSYSGFKNNETEEALTKKPAITCIATSGSAVGTYDIVVSGAESWNYEFTYVAGILTIEEVVKIVPMEEETEVVFDAIITEETDLKDVVIDNVYVTLDTDADDGYDTEEKCIVLASIVADEQLDAIKDKEVNDETVKENFNGLIFAVPAGKGVINITAKTKGNRTLNVKIGDTDPQTFVQPERGVVEIPYVSDEDTYVYVYGADVAASGKRRVASADIDNGVLIYNIKWTTEELTDIDVVTTEGNDNYQIYTPDGKSVETLQKGVNIIRFFDGTTKSVYVK